MSRSEKDQLVAGLHSVRSVLARGPERILEVWVDRRRKDRRLNDVLSELRGLGLACQEVERSTLDKLSGGTNHQGIVLRTRAPAALDEKALWRLLDDATEPPFLLVLDGVQDPHNLGACLRTADAAGVMAVIAPRDKSVGLTPVVAKVASGAAESVPFIQVTNLARVLDRLADDYRCWIIGTAGEADKSLFAADLRGPLALVLGAEGEGLRRLTRERCSDLVHIPMAGAVESLNVSVATGVCLFEAVRQRVPS